MSKLVEAFEAVKASNKIDTEGYALREAGSGLYNPYYSEQRVLVKGMSMVTLIASTDGIEFSNWRTFNRELEDLQSDIRFRIVASAIGEAYNGMTSEEREERRRLEEERLEKLKREADERQARLAEREEKLLTEFIGDQARVRLRGEQSLHGIHIKAEKRGEEYHVGVSWMKSENYGKYFRLENVMILDVMVGVRYRELWNDGYDDLLPHEGDKIAAKRKSVKKYES